MNRRDVFKSVASAFGGVVGASVPAASQPQVISDIYRPSFALLDREYVEHLMLASRHIAVRAYNEMYRSAHAEHSQD